MSEPSVSATRTDEIAAGVWHYGVDDDRIRARSEAYAVVDGDTAVLIDPLPLARRPLARLGRATDVVITSPGHQRSAWRLRRELRARIWTPAGAQGLEEGPDETYGDGASLPGGLLAVNAPGPKGPHFVLLLERQAGVLFAADLLMNLPDTGLTFLPDQYLEDPLRARASGRALLAWPWELLCPAHGAPTRDRPRQRLLLLLEGSAAK